jgi:hypothetical protein
VIALVHDSIGLGKGRCDVAAGMAEAQPYIAPDLLMNGDGLVAYGYQWVEDWW